MTGSPIDALTPREREILALIAEGDSLSEIAQKLSRSLKTIESHRLSLGRKLKVSNRVELAKIAIATGLVRLSEAGLSHSVTAAGDQQLQWIEEINSAIEQATGRDLIKRFCKAASVLPGIDIAAVCTCEKDRQGNDADLYNRIIMAVFENGEVKEPMRYNAKQTPCQEIIDQGFCSFTSGIRDAYPGDQWLALVEAEGYLGLQLNDAAGKQVGGVGFIGREPFQAIETYRYIIDFFAPRLSGAIQTCTEIESLRSQNDRLQSDLLDPTMRETAGSSPEGDHVMTVARREIAQRVHQLAGTSFLREVIDALCDVFGLYAGGICALDPAPSSPTLHSVSFCIQRSQGDPIHYEAKGTPCEIVLRQSGLCVEDNAAEAYPGDIFMQQHKIRGFCGNRLPGLDGTTAGVIWVVHQAPLPEPEGISTLLKYYAPRLGAELANFMQLEMLMQERERLESLVAQQQKEQHTKTPA
ncbi:MAG: helix-turn-helix transcriptional regulator [Planctomycetota bacterium]